MLTEIEWWGGMLFIWGGLCYWLAIREIDDFLSWGNYAFHLSYFCSAVALALYFYPLNSTLLQYVYVGAVVIAIIFMVVDFLADTEEDESESDPEQKTNVATEQNAEAEEYDGRYDLIGQIFVQTPPVVACVLGLMKSYGIAQVQGWW